MTVKEALQELIDSNKRQAALLEQLMRVTTAGQATDTPVPNDSDEEVVVQTTGPITLTEYERLYEERPKLRELQPVLRSLRRRQVPITQAVEFATRFGNTEVSASNLHTVANDQFFYNANYKRHYVPIGEEKAANLIRVLEAMLALTEPQEEVEEAERV